MIILIYGGSGSGKSAYAEDKALSLYKKEDKKDSLYYIATMMVYGEEGREKVEKHRQMREGKGFYTIEQPTQISQVCGQLEEESIVLVECLSNLVANEMFTPSKSCGTQQHTHIVSRIIKDFILLAQRAKHVIVVTNNVFEDGIQYEPSTMEYIETLGKINEKLAAKADQVIEVVVGIPIILKEGRECNYEIHN